MHRVNIRKQSKVRLLWDTKFVISLQWISDFSFNVVETECKNVE